MPEEPEEKDEEAVLVPTRVLKWWAEELSKGVLHPQAEYAEGTEQQLRSFILNMKSTAYGLHGRLLKASRGDL